MSKNSAINISTPVLGQLLSFIPTDLFKNSVKTCQFDKSYKRVMTWDHFFFMFYGVLTGSSTIREIIKNSMLMSDKLAHCSIFKIPKRSSISDANANHTSQVFGHLYSQLYRYYKKYFSDSFLSMPINGQVLPDKVKIFDSTVVTLFKEIFKACERLPENGRKKGGLKVFTKMRLSERVPNFICLKTATATNEKVLLSYLDPCKGVIAVFDKGFQKFKQYEQWNQHGVFYLTRVNKNGKFKVTIYRALEENCEVGVCFDAEIELEYDCKKSNTIKSTIARMVTYIDPTTGNRLVFLTNLMNLKAMTICSLYKSRWTIEPLFKQIKQNFELTYFLPDHPEGIKSQIWVAMILNLIFTVIHKIIKEVEDFSTMVKLATKNIASKVGLIKFLKMSSTQISQYFNYLENVQLELFDQNNNPELKNSS